jgi:predicted aspartyl protease
LASPPVEALVDTGSELTWLPRDLLVSVRIAPVRKRSFSTATQQLVTRDTGYAILTAEGFETVDEVVFGEPGDMTLLGVRTLAGFGVMVDYLAHRFVATTAIVATLGAPSCQAPSIVFGNLDTLACTNPHKFLVA